jgi:purine-binding chemotaxis protein CheW
MHVMATTEMEKASERTWNPLEILDTDLADEEDAAADSANTNAYLIFQLQGQWLAANVCQVREILDDQPLTPLPNAPHDVEGMIDVRGKGITVVNLAQHLGIRVHSEVEPERIVVFEFERTSKAPLAIGVRTETVRDVCQINDRDIEETPEALNDWDQSMLLGVSRFDDRIVILIDLSAIIAKCGDDADIFSFS